MARTPLMIIDVQPGFIRDADFPELHAMFANIRREIRRARSRGGAIVVVEMDEYGESLFRPAGSLLAVKTWDNLCADPDEVPQDVDRLLLRSDRVRLCGLNANACVGRTANGLTFRYDHLTVEVAPTACVNLPSLPDPYGKTHGMFDRWPYSTNRRILVRAA